METSRNLLSSSSLENANVKNREGEDLGNIKDFMIDCDSGNVVYAVLSFGGVLGMADKLFAVPIPALHLDTGEKCFRLNISKEELENAPGFDNSDWPDMADPRWGADIHRFYKTQPNAER